MTKLFDSSASPWRSPALAVAAALLFSGAASAQSGAPASSNKDDTHGAYSLLDLDIFGGYQWFQIFQGTSGDVHRFAGSANWGERITSEFSDYIAAEAGIQIGYNALQFRAFGAVPLTQVSAGNTQIYTAGVLNFAKRDAKYRPFILVGPEYVFYKAPNLSNIVNAPATPTLILPAADKEQGRTAITYGIGLKINSSPKLAWRFDLRGTRSGSPHYGWPGVASVPGTVYLPGGYIHESSLTASVGLTFRFRYREPITTVVAPPPPPPPAPKADVHVGAITGAHDVCPGEDVRLSVTASGWLPDQTPAYQWMVNGSQAAGGTSSSFSVPTADGAGAKNVSVRVSAGDSSATATAVTVNVRPLTPPTIRFGISPSTVSYGARVPLAATGTGSACGGPVTIRYSGQGVSGSAFDSTALSFDMSNRLKQQSQTVTVTATAVDQKNQSVSATAPVTVTLTAEVRRMPDIVFPQASARVNNCAKRVLLEELTPMLAADPGAKVILIGHRDESEKGRANARLDETRVINSAAVLSAGKGICPSLDLSRVMVNWVGTDQNDETKPALCGTSTNVKEKGGQGVKESDKRAPFRRVEIWFVPGGVATPGNLTGLKDAPVKDIQAKGCPK
jgi:outer membrane protein OmpA-like peptidoglycan-associated protein